MNHDLVFIRQWTEKFFINFQHNYVILSAIYKQVPNKLKAAFTTFDAVFDEILRCAHSLISFSNCEILIEEALAGEEIFFKKRFCIVLSMLPKYELGKNNPNSIY